jgi:hypothetical protein
MDTNPSLKSIVVISLHEMKIKLVILHYQPTKSRDHIVHGLIHIPTCAITPMLVGIFKHFEKIIELFHTIAIHRELALLQQMK